MDLIGKKGFRQIWERYTHIYFEKNWHSHICRYSARLSIDYSLYLHCIFLHNVQLHNTKSQEEGKSKVQDFLPPQFLIHRFLTGKISSSWLMMWCAKMSLKHPENDWRNFFFALLNQILKYQTVHPLLKFFFITLILHRRRGGYSGRGQHQPGPISWEIM